MKIFVGADHRGFYLRNSLIKYLAKAGYDVVDEGNTHLDPEDDFPQFATKVVTAMRASDDPEPKGILICGSGQGMCMAANRFKGIRAVLAWSDSAAKESRHDEDSNLLCLPAEVLEKDKANIVVEAWINTPFSGAPRYKRRIKELDELT
jgi:ribose 5-phosphate isomerase B